MDSVIICKSVHKGNTRKIAEAVAEVLGCEIIKPGDVESLGDYGGVGFASGIYYGDFHKSIRDLVDDSEGDGKLAFLISTSGFRPLPIFHTYESKMKERLRINGFEVVGSFTCRGHDEFGPLGLFGGMHKNRPNENDLKEAKKFAEELMEDG